MDLTDTLAPTSDQLDAVDLLGGPRTFTITRVERNNGDQPVNIHLAEFPRVWRPGKSMRRVLAAAWGTDATQYAGRRVTLYCDPNVKFGGETVGGTRISHLSDIPKPLAIPLLVTRGKSATFRVQPLPDLTPVERLRAEWQTADPERRKVIEAEVARLQGKRPADRAQGEPAAAPVDEAPVVEDPPEHDPTLDADWPGEPLDGAR